MADAPKIALPMFNVQEARRLAREAYDRRMPQDVRRALSACINALDGVIRFDESRHPKDGPAPLTAESQISTLLRVMLHAGYGHFTGTTHYYTNAPIQIGRIKRDADESLCRARSELVYSVRSGPPDQKPKCRRCCQIAQRLTLPEPKETQRGS